MSIIERIIKERHASYRASGAHPTACYLGTEEWDAFRSSNEVLQSARMDPANPHRPPEFYGMEIYRVATPSHFAVVSDINSLKVKS